MANPANRPSSLPRGFWSLINVNRRGSRKVRLKLRGVYTRRQYRYLKTYCVLGSMFTFDFPNIIAEY